MLNIQMKGAPPYRLRHCKYLKEKDKKQAKKYLEIRGNCKGLNISHLRFVYSERLQNDNNFLVCLLSDTYPVNNFVKTLRIYIENLANSA